MLNPVSLLLAQGSMNKHHPANAKLMAIRLFREFDPSELDELLELAEPWLIPVGRNIVTQGDSGHSMFIVTEGEALAVMRQPDGLEMEVGKFKVGDIFGELALLDSQRRNADVIAVTDCMVMTITTGLMRMVGLAFPRAAFKLSMAILELVGRRLHDADERYVHSLNIVSALAAESTVMSQERVA